MTTIGDDQELFSRTWPGAEFGIPSNGWYYVNNTFGKGSLVNGTDFRCWLTADQATFPDPWATIEWDFGQGEAGYAPGFAYGYPALVYGSTPYGGAKGPFNEPGPWPQRIKDIQACKLAYNILVGGNWDSFNVLVDMYATDAPDSDDGSHVIEISFFPYLNSRVSLDGTELVHFDSIGWCRAGLFGKQAKFIPTDEAGGEHVAIFTGAVEMLELFRYAVGQGWCSADAYIRGAEFGAEAQIPATYNSAPYRGRLIFVSEPAWDWS